MLKVGDVLFSRKDSQKRFQIIQIMDRILAQIWTERNGYEGRRFFQSETELYGIAKF